MMQIGIDSFAARAALNGERNQGGDPHGFALPVADERMPTGTAPGRTRPLSEFVDQVHAEK
jgi:hypothetical protein